jgi:hypothetical protein
MCEIKIGGRIVEISLLSKTKDGKIDIAATIKSVSIVGGVLIATVGTLYGCGKAYADLKITQMHQEVFIPTMTEFVKKISYTERETDSIIAYCNNKNNEEVRLLLHEISFQMRVNNQMHIDNEGIEAYNNALKKVLAIDGSGK